MYELVDTLTGVPIRGTTYEPLYKHFVKVRKANGHPIGLSAEDELVKMVCEKYPDECEGYDPNLPRRRKLGYRDVLNGTRVMVAHRVAGSPLVDRVETDQRAAICMECNFNSDFDKPCGGHCPDLKALVMPITKARPLPYADKLKSCGICGCFLEAAVQLPLDIQCIGVTETQKNQFKYVTNRQGKSCWKTCQ